MGRIQDVESHQKLTPPAIGEFARGTAPTERIELDAAPAPLMLLRPTARVAMPAIARTSRDTSDLDIACIAHDLNGPLSIIALESYRLAAKLDDLASIDAPEALRTIQHNVAFLERMVRDLVDRSRLADGALVLRTKATELGGLVANVVERAISLRDRTRVLLTRGPPLVATIDRLRIERVLSNMLANALKFAPPKSPIIVNVEQRGVTARISVIDVGPGLADVDAAVVFDRHRRVLIARTYDGAGLGLYVSRQIIEAHGGRMGVESRVGEGACFFFELPLVAPARAEPASFENRRRLAGAHVLLVDGDPRTGELAERLRREGLVVSVATSLAIARARAASRRFAAIVIDLEIEATSGPSLVRHLRAHLPDVPVVLLTAEALHHPQTQITLDLVGAEYVEKPCDIGLLIAALARAIERYEVE